VRLLRPDIPANDAAGEALHGAVRPHGQGGAAATSPLTYVRPHDVEILRHANGSTFPARIDHISFAGPVVNVTLRRSDDGAAIEAALTRDRYKELSLRQDDAVHVRFKHAVTFENDYSI